MDVGDRVKSVSGYYYTITGYVYWRDKKSFYVTAESGETAEMREELMRSYYEVVNEEQSAI